MLQKKSYILTLLAQLGMALSIMAFIVAIVLYFVNSELKHGAPLTISYCLIAGERFWFSLFKSKEKSITKVTDDWTVVAIGLSYIFMMYGTIFELHFIRHEVVCTWTMTGCILYFIAFGLRWWSVKTLGNQWAIHVDGKGRLNNVKRKLIRNGPYGYVRHPIYLAAIVEVMAIPLIFNAFYVLIFSFLVCIPMQAKRAYFEEKGLSEIFGQEYIEYKDNTPALFPFKKTKRESKSN